MYIGVVTDFINWIDWSSTKVLIRAQSDSEGGGILLMNERICLVISLCLESEPRDLNRGNSYSADLSGLSWEDLGSEETGHRDDFRENRLHLGMNVNECQLGGCGASVVVLEGNCDLLSSLSRTGRSGGDDLFRDLARVFGFCSFLSC